MLYQKRANETWTGLCIYFDENFWLENRNDEECYRILYLLYYMLACKKKYFKSFQQYDEYAQLATNMIFMRFDKKKKAGLKVKSVLNYVKSTLYAQKVAYQNTEFREILPENDSRNTGLIEMMRDNVQQNYNEGMTEDIIDTFYDIPHIINKVVKSTPYKNNNIISRRLRISCALTLLKSFTLSKEDMEKLKLREEKGLDTTKNLYKMFGKERETSTTLWKLDSSMESYVKVLTNQIRKKIIRSVNEVRDKYTLDESTIDAILMSSWNESSHNEGDFDND